MRVTIRHIARDVNVSHTTVSRVLSGRDDTAISVATRQRVLDSVRRLGYVPNQAARTLATGRTNTIAFWVGDLFHPFAVHVMHYLAGVLERCGYGMTVHWENRTTASNAWEVDGAIVLDNPTGIERLLQNGENLPPLVSIGGYVSEKTDFVSVDLEGGGYNATRHLLQQGRQQIAYLVNPLGSKEKDARHRGYVRAMTEANLSPEIILAPTSARADSRQAILRYLQANQGNNVPDGLFCYNDDMAIGAYRGLCDAGIRVPDDMAIIGCDGIEDTEYLETPLSSIALPYTDLCVAAVEFLENRLKSPEIPLQQRILSPELVLRKSSMEAAINATPSP